MSVKFAGHTPPPRARQPSPGNSIDSEEKHYLNEWSELSDKYHDSFEEEELDTEEPKLDEVPVSHVTLQPLPDDILLDDDLISDPQMQLPDQNNNEDTAPEDDKAADGAALEGMDLETYMNSAINSKSEGEENGTPEMMDTMMQGLDGVSPPISQRKRRVQISTPLSHRSSAADDSPSQQVLQSILHEISDMKSQLHDMHVSPNKSSDVYHQYDHLLHRKPTKSIKALLGHKQKSKDSHASDINYNLSASGVAKMDLSDEAKMNKLISEVHRYSSIVERQNDKIALLEEQVAELTSAVEQKDQTIQIGKVNRALRAKKQLSQRVDELQLEMADYEQVLSAVESLRQNETQLLQKIQYLMNQNEDLSIQLKNSLTREIEWRSMHKIELSNQLHTSIPAIAKQEKTASAPSLASRTTEKIQQSSNSTTSKKKKQKRHSISDNILPRISK